MFFYPEVSCKNCFSYLICGVTSTLLAKILEYEKIPKIEIHGEKNKEQR